MYLKQVYPAGTRLYFSYGTGYCGMNSGEFVELTDDWNGEQLSDYAWEAAVQNAERYGYYPMPGDIFNYTEEDIASMENDPKCVESIWGDFAVYDPKLHDGKTIGGKIFWNKL